MADAAQIAELRRYINEPVDAEPWTDAELAARIDAGTSTRLVASEIWEEKAASYSELIDVQEGNSNRKLSQLRAQASAMAKDFASDPSGVLIGTIRRSRTRPIERM